MYSKIIEELIKNKETISIVDSSTNGYISMLFSETIGYNKVLKFACNPINDEYKVRFGIKESTMNVYGAFSKEAAKESVEGLASFTHSDYAVSIIGNLISDDYLEAQKDKNTIYFAFFKRKTNQIFVTTLNVETTSLELKRKDIASFVERTLSSLVLG